MNTHAPAAAWPRDPLGLATIEVDGLPFVATTKEVLSERIVASAQQDRGGWVVTPNLDILRRWHRDGAFRSLIENATLFTADGAPIVWASRLQRNPLPARLTGSDLFVTLFVQAIRAGLKVALIGGNPGAAENAARELASRHELPPGLVRTHCPPFGFEDDAEQLKSIESLAVDWRPHIVFVGLGSPKQEKLIAHLRSLRPDAWYLGVGVSFSFVAGDVKRAPRWMQQTGLEWLHRLCQEPSRLIRRYLVDGIPFAVRLLARAALGPNK